MKARTGRKYFKGRHIHTNKGESSSAEKTGCVHPLPSHFCSSSFFLCNALPTQKETFRLHPPVQSPLSICSERSYPSVPDPFVEVLNSPLPAAPLWLVVPHGGALCAHFKSSWPGHLVRLRAEPRSSLYANSPWERAAFSDSHKTLSGSTWFCCTLSGTWIHRLFPVSLYAH